MRALKKAESDAAKKLKDLEEICCGCDRGPKPTPLKKVKKKKRVIMKILTQFLKTPKKKDKKYAKNMPMIKNQLTINFYRILRTRTKHTKMPLSLELNPIYGSYNLFDLVGSDADYSGTDLLDNLQSQVQCLERVGAIFTEILQIVELVKGLVEELQNMGPSSKAQINALLTLTDEQLSEYVNLFESKIFLGK